MAITIKSILMRARNIIMKRGWVKWQYTGPNGEVCATQAISEARCNSSTEYLQATNRLRKFLPKEKFGSIASYNDDEKTKKEDIIKLFDKAIQNK